MFDRLQKPYLTVETGEAYQPVRLTYELHEKNGLIPILSTLQCLEKTTTPNLWNWFWKEECNDLHFESLTDFRRHPTVPIRLGTVMVREDKLYINLPSFKRACLAVPFFHRVITPAVAHVQQADFLNKVFGLDERLPHGFTELFKDEELDRILNQRLEEYGKVKEKCEHAPTAEEAFSVLSDYAEAESKKRLPYAERYNFETEATDPDVVFLSFYIFLRGRELIAIKRWYGESGYTLSDAIDQTVEEMFGGLGVDIIE